MMFKIIRNIFLISLLILGIVIGIIGGMGYVDYQEIVKQETINDKVNDLRENEHYVKIDQISPDFLHAVVAIEDHRFYEHGGIDYISLVRITLANVMAKEILGGGSTITQQLAKNLYFMDSNKFTRKVSEAFVAKELENNYSKDEILEMYVNIIYYGDNYYGIQQAAQGYFNVAPSNLSLAQASMLAGLPQAPSVYALSSNNKETYKRQEEVLKAMIKYEYISNDEFLKALKESL